MLPSLGLNAGRAELANFDEVEAVVLLHAIAATVAVNGIYAEIKVC